MLLRLLLAFTFLPLLEIYLLVRVGSRIGAWPTVALVLGTGMAGAWLARAQGLSVMARIRENMARGVPPTGELVDALLIFAAGVVLITPGMITDACGLALLLPPVRRALKAWLTARFALWAAQGRVHVAHGPSGPGGPSGPYGPFGNAPGGDPFGRTEREVRVINPEPDGGEPGSRKPDDPDR